MYFENTTLKERDIIRDALCSSFFRLDKLARLLDGVIEDSFSAPEQRPLNQCEAEHVSDMLFIASDLLSTVLTEYDLMTCSDSYRANLHRESQKREALAMRCSENCKKLEDAERHMSIDERKVSHDERIRAVSLPDEQAAPILERLLRSAAL